MFFRHSSSFNTRGFCIRFVYLYDRLKNLALDFHSSTRLRCSVATSSHLRRCYRSHSRRLSYAHTLCVDNCISQMGASVILTHTVGRSSVWSSKRFAVGRDRHVPQVLYYPPYVINSPNAQHWMLGHTFSAGVLRGAYGQACP